MSFKYFPGTLIKMNVKFAHMSDCHLGSWNAHPDLRELPPKAFEIAMDKCIAARVDFIIIAGDLFDTSFPPIDILQRCAAALHKAREAGIRIYYVAGSHDYSPTGKSMLNVLEEAGLMTNVAKGEEADGKLLLKPTIDKTGAKLYGIFGRKGSLEVRYFDDLDRRIEEDEGFKIFVMHCGIAEYKPERFSEMAAVPLSSLPKNFDYYASGHVHTNFVDKKHNIVFPGPLFPAGMDELENYDSGFYIFDKTLRRENVRLHDITLVKVGADGKNSGDVEREILEKIDSVDAENRIVLVHLKGVLETGKPSDIDYRKATGKAMSKGAFCVKYRKNISTKEFEEISVDSSLSTEKLERKLIAEHASQLQTDNYDAVQVIPQLMDIFSEEKKEDETNIAYEERIKTSAKKVLGL